MTSPENEAIVSRETAGGNPGAHLRIETIIPNHNNGATGLAIYEGFSTTQPLDGRSFRLTIDAREIVGTAQLLLLLLRQGDSIYELSVNTIHAPLGSWATFSNDGTLSPQAFEKRKGTGPDRPDLSGGTETFFGFAGTNGGFGRTYDWDNFNLRN